MTNRYASTKDYVVIIRHILDKVPAEPEYGQVHLAADLRKFTNRKNFTAQFISNVMRGHELIDPDDYTHMDKGLALIIKKFDIKPENLEVGNIPISLYLDHQRHIYTIYQDDGPHILVHNRDLGSVADSLIGMWRFFYLTPTGRRNGNLITNVAFFHNNGRQSTTASGVLFGEHVDRWLCTATINGRNFLQMGWMNGSAEETSYGIATLPDRMGTETPKMVGVCTLLQQEQQLPRPIVSTIFFGTRCTLETCGYGDLRDGQELPNKEEESQLSAVVNNAIAGEYINREAENVIRRWFRMTNLTIGEFHLKFPEMSNYLTRIREIQPVILISDGLEFITNQRNTLGEGEAIQSS